MGYRGKADEQERARALRAQAWTLQEIADELGVAKHVHGCPTVSYGCSRTHRNVMGLVHALLSSEALPG